MKINSPNLFSSYSIPLLKKIIVKDALTNASFAFIIVVEKKMKYNEKEIVLKNGKELILRSCDYDDAQSFLDFFKQAAGETENMVRYPEEINIAVSALQELAREE